MCGIGDRMLKMAVGMQFEDSDESTCLQWQKPCFLHNIPAYGGHQHYDATQV
jgi:hypothetical protein